MSVQFHICWAKEAERPDCPINTREGQEEWVLKQVREFGGFTVFWATEHQMRANAIVRLEERGAIVRNDNGEYPWCGYDLKEAK